LTALVTASCIDAVDVGLGFRRQCHLDPTPLHPDAQFNVRPEGRLAGDGAAYRAKFTGPYDHRTLKGIGHNVPQEAPEAFARAVLDVALF